MEYRVLGRTELLVTPLALGTSHFGWRTGMHESTAILDRHHTHGGNFIETASVWCRDAVTAALVALPSEEHVGRWLQMRAMPRHEIVLACRILLDAGLAVDPHLGKHLLANCERTLRRLHTDRLDLLLIEWDETLRPLERLSAALRPLVRRGWVAHVGVSGFPAWRIAAGNALAHQHSLPPFKVARAPFSLLEPRRFELEYSDLCSEQHLGFLAQAPLAASALVRKLPLGAHRGWSCGRTTAAAGSIRHRLAHVAQQRGVGVAQVELAWVLGHPGVGAAVVEPASVAELDRLHAATLWRLGDDERRQLREHWVPAGGSRRAVAVTPLPGRRLSSVPVLAGGAWT